MKAKTLIDQGIFKRKMGSHAYHAELYKNTPQGNARLIESEGSTILQAYTDRELGTEGLTAPKSFRTYCFGKNWHNILIIDPKLNRLHLNYSYGHNYGDSYHTYTIYPKKLYAIPQPVWEQFIGQLEDQKVVDLLNLKTHRHLWPGYNYSVKASSLECRYRAAEQINQHHFLISHPSVNEILNDSKPIFKPKEIKDNPALLNKTFIKKVAYCPTIDELILLAALISNYCKLDRKNDEPESKTESAIINWIPDSRTQIKEFRQAIITARVLKSVPSKANEVISANLFFNSRKKWKNYSSDYLNAFSFRNLKDYLDALYNDLILRKVLVSSKSCPSLRIIEENLAKHFYLLLTKVSLCQIEPLENRWHRNLAVIEAAKPPGNKSPSWQPLIENTCLNGFTIRVLTSEAALKAHGAEMQHCVGGYGPRCLEGLIDIIEVTDKKGNKSTLEIERVKGTHFLISQHKGYKNSPPLWSHSQIAVKLITQLNNKTIPVNNARLDEPAHYVSKYPYEIDDLATQEVIYQAYKKNKLLPTKLIAANYQAMVDKLGLDKLIIEIKEEHAGAGLSRPPEFRF
ncbi:MAG: PcfJ domain-containing protein [Tatlockia sp.]|nr:PcfJ domain-containing protein [Tatlockia sp.]